MFLEKIHLVNYRNIIETLHQLNPNINILLGYNGQGKTNFIESIYILGTGSSHKNNADRELINWQHQKALIRVLLKRRDQDLKISLLIDRSGKKAEINDTPLARISELIGNINVVLFSPEDLNLVKGGPYYRRRFIDLEISQVSPYYYYQLQKYNHVLKQRNNLLKEIRDKKSDDKLLEMWDQQLIETGSKIILKRIKVIDKLKILARLSQRQITNGSENLSVEYDLSLKEVLGDEEQTRLIFKHLLTNNRKEEIKRGYTLFGPHRDDLVFKVNNVDIRKYGSQGQQRTTSLALKLAELEYMKSETGEYPILLLDDVFSELDQKRSNTLLNLIDGKIQTFITTTDLTTLDNLKQDNYSFFQVEKGVLTLKG